MNEHLLKGQISSALLPLESNKKCNFIYFILISLLFAALFLPNNVKTILIVYMGLLGCFFMYLIANIGKSLFLIERFIFYCLFLTGFLGSALLPVSAGPFTLFPFRILLFFLWFGFIAHALINKGKVTFPIYENNVRWSCIFGGLWLGYALLSLGWAYSTTLAVRNIAFLFIGVSLVFFTIYFVRSTENIQRLYGFWLVLLFFFCLHGLFEHFTGQHLSTNLSDKALITLKYIPRSVFNNPNDFATFLTISVPFAMSYLHHGRGLFYKITAIILIIASFYLIIMTGSRANILAVLIGFCFLIFFLTNIKSKLKILTGTIILSFLLFQTFNWGSPLYSKLQKELSSLTSEKDYNQGSLFIRRNLIKNGLIFVTSTLGFGVGAGNAENWMENFPVYETLDITNPHNWWVEVLVNYGMFVFIGYVAIYILIIKRLWRFHKKTENKSDKMISEALLLALICFSLSSVSSSSIMAFKPQWQLFAVALAFLNVYGREMRLKNKSSNIILI